MRATSGADLLEEIWRDLSNQLIIVVTERSNVGDVGLVYNLVEINFLLTIDNIFDESTMNCNIILTKKKLRYHALQINTNVVDAFNLMKIVSMIKLDDQFQILNFIKKK